jgi:hypothetical protein
LHKIMPWDRGYYYRARKVNGRVCRQYMGRGPLVELLAEADADERALRDLERRAARAERDRDRTLDEQVQALDEAADLLAEAALLAAGYHRHHRGEWRKRRAREDEGR